MCGVGEKLDVFGKHWREDNSYELVSICEKKCVIRFGKFGYIDILVVKMCEEVRNSLYE